MGKNVKDAEDTSTTPLNKNIVLVDSLLRQNRTLELFDRFEFFWKKLDNKGFFDKSSQYYFWIGLCAGFTDTRVVYIWLKSRQMFVAKEREVDLHILKLPDKIDLQKTEMSRLVQFLKKSGKNETLSYSAEPRIG